MNTIRIAFRNMTRQQKRSILLGGAIAFGIFIVSLINGFTGGLLDNIKENFSHMMAGHIYITGSELTSSGRVVQIVRDDAAITDAVSQMEYPIKYITRRSTASGTLIFGSREINQRIDGVNWNQESYFKEKLMLTRGSLDGLDDPKALILSENAARDLNVQVGETLLVRVSTVTGQQNVDEFKLIATTVDQSFIGSMTAYAHLDYINQLLNLKAGEYQSFNIFLEKMEDMDPAKAKLTTLLATRVRMTPQNDAAATEDDVAGDPLAHGGGGNARGARQAMAGNIGGGFGGMMSGLFSRSQETWQGVRYTISTLNEMLGMVMNMVTFLNGFSLVILLILLVIIMVGITNTFRMILIERVREIGTMRALGMQKKGVMNIFLLEALFISIFGAIGGLVIALVVMFGLSLIAFPTNTMFFLFLSGGHASFFLNPAQVIGNIVLIALFSVLAALLPAVKAARLEPAKALGTHY